jgi:hypothetical protein
MNDIQFLILISTIYLAISMRDSRGFLTTSALAYAIGAMIVAMIEIFV